MAAPSVVVRPRVDPRLYGMMFLQYAVWGIWMPILPHYLRASTADGGLGFDEWQLGLIGAVAASVGAIASPFLGGQFADRYFSTEKYLAAVMILGGAVNWVLSQQTSFAAWMALSIVYALIYMPTLGLTNGLAMAHLSDTKRQFAGVRLWGTIAWITVAWLFPMFWLTHDVHFQWLPPFYAGTDVPNKTARIVDALKASGLISFGYGLFCLALPHTPPKRDAVQRLAFAEAFRLIRHRSVMVLVLASLPLAAIHKIYFLQTYSYLETIGVSVSPMSAMSIAQFAEIFVMAALGLMLTRLGFRWVLFVGAFCYFLRFAAFGTTSLPVELIVASQFLHGFCFACLYAGGFIYIDRIAPPDIRHSAQTGFTIILLGVGPLLGGWLNGWLGERVKVDGVIQYEPFWYTCAAIGLVSALAIALLFRDETEFNHG